MIRPLAICLEDLQAGSSGRRYLRCVAVVGRAPGLRVDGAGAVWWRDETAAACELWVSADGRLVLYRLEGGGPVLVRRGSRSLDAPPSRPVILLDQDELEIGRRCLRVHVHGDAPRVHPPEYLPPARSRATARLAAALALGAALGAADCKKDTPAAGGEREIEVRTAPPKIAAPPEDVAEPDESDASAESTDAGTDAERDAVVALPDTVPDIEVRIAPPQVAAPMMDVVEPIDVRDMPPYVNEKK
jgi:hypothetical protein